MTDPDLDLIRHGESYEEAYAGTPLVSVCIATYNRARILCERTLPTVLRQSYPNWEAVIVGDACVDDTAARIAALGDSRLHFYNRPVNGPYPEETRRRWLVAGVHPGNEALERARGRWIAGMNDDDEWTGDHVEALMAEALSTHAELVYGQMRVKIHGTGQESWFGSWPPQHGDFGLQAAVYHGDLRAFRLDIDAHELDEPADWNLARRMLAAGVRIEFLSRPVGTYHLAANHAGEAWWSERAVREGTL